MSKTAKLQHRLFTLRLSQSMGFPLTQAELNELFELKRKLKK